jgi:Spy/CpxP family protein refolding chaperone
MNRSRILLSTLAAASIAIAAGAEPVGPGGPGGRGPGRDRPGPGGPGDADGPHPAMIEHLVNNPRVAKDLGLSDEQVDTLRNAMFDLREERVRLEAAMELAAIQQARILTGEEIDEAALMAAVEKTGEIRTEIAKHKMRTLLFVQETLTKEQRAKVQQHVRRRMADARNERNTARQNPGNARRDANRPREVRGDHGPRQDGPPPEDRGND